MSLILFENITWQLLFWNVVYYWIRTYDAKYSTHTQRDDLLANHVKHKGEKYRDGMLRGSEDSKDSYHSPVKKIKTIKN